MNISIIIELVKSIGGILKNVLLAWFFVKSGKDKQELKQSKQEIKNAKESAKRHNKVKSLDDERLRNILVRKPKSK